jgi:succinate dehydrogenase/fumarate reductase flavoprotein subunit
VTATGDDAGGASGSGAVYGVPQPVDLLVIGGGMAGMSAGAWVARHGGSVVLVERAASIGGSARYAGYLHTARSADELRLADPGADEGLQQRLVEGFPDGLQWLRSLDVDCSDEVDVLRLTRGRRVDTNGYLRACSRLIQDSPTSTVLVDTRVEHLLVADGAVVGAAIEREGGREEVRARWTLLATGGFQGDPDLVAEHIHAHGPLMPLRSNPTSRGDGLRLGETVGAAIGPKGAGFYGHLVPWGVDLADPSQFAPLSQYHSDHGLLFNLRGERFVDETLGDHVNAIAVLEQPDARALLVIDERVRQEWMLTPLVADMEQMPDRFELALRRGGRCAAADDLEEFSYLPEEWGYPGGEIGAAIAEVNAAAPSQPSPTRGYDNTPLVDPPFYVMDVRPAITFSYPGLVIDPDAHVLDERTRAIPGLLAAGADAGGTFARDYAGGLANALVFGLQAARTALARTTSAP